MDYKEVESSNIARLAFDPGSPDTDFGTLAIVFTSGDEYLYAEVPATVAEELLNAESVGKAFYSMVRGKYTAIKTEEEEE